MPNLGRETGGYAEVKFGSFDESKVKRDGDGKFADKEGGGGPESKGEITGHKVNTKPSKDDSRWTDPEKKPKGDEKMDAWLSELDQGDIPMLEGIVSDMKKSIPMASSEKEKARLRRVAAWHQKVIDALKDD